VWWAWWGVVIILRQASSERTYNCADSATYEVTDPNPNPNPKTHPNPNPIFKYF